MNRMHKSHAMRARGLGARLGKAAGLGCLLLAASPLAAQQPITSYACTQVNHSGTDYSNRSLVGQNFADQNLSNANFSNSDLSGANFEGADLTGADFSGATLAQGPEAGASTAFTNANLSNACFDQVVIKGSQSAIGADFQFANLACAAFTSTDLDGAQFGPSINTPSPPSATCRTSFAGTTMTCSFLPQWKLLDLTEANITACQAQLAGLDLSGALMTGVQFQYMNLSGTNFTDATLNQANLYSATLTSALFNGANLQLATLSSVQAQNAQFNNQAQLSGATLAYGNFQEAQFSGAVFQAQDGLPAATLSFSILENANFTNAEMIGVNLSGATLDQSTVMRSATIQNANFSNATLSSIQLPSAKLNGVVFDYADLINASFTGASFLASDGFRAASLVKANLQGADFTQAILNGVNLTNSAVALSEGVPLFSITDDVSGLISDLNSGNLTAELNAGFEQHGYALQYCTSPALAALSKSQWTIRVAGRPSHGHYATYLLTSVVSGGKSTGVSVAGISVADESKTPLFTVDGSFVDALNAQQIPRAIFAAFASNAQTLPPCADPMLTSFRAQQYWTLNTSQVSATAPVVGYVGFRISELSPTALKVYGTEVMTVYQGPDGRLTWTPFTVTPTKISADYFDDQTVCPNGVTYGANVQANVSFEDMMTAPSPPAPPACAPGSGMCK